jgi:hypothetical protein
MRGLFLRSGRSPDWLKMKNAAAPAMKRDAEEDLIWDLLDQAAVRAGTRSLNCR